MSFFSPTNKLKELLLLKHIEKYPKTTQKEIAKVIEGAPSMVNLYIDNLEEKNYLKREYLSSKTVYYHITAEGIKRKNYLFITYFHELIRLYRLAEEQIEKFLKSIEDKGFKDILIYGGGEVAETMVRALKQRRDRNLKIVAIVDDYKDEEDMEYLGYKIIRRNEIKYYKHDAIIITSYSYEDEIINKLEEIDYPEERIERMFGE